MDVHLATMNVATSACMSIIYGHIECWYRYRYEHLATLNVGTEYEHISTSRVGTGTVICMNIYRHIKSWTRYMFEHFLMATLNVGTGKGMSKSAHQNLQQVRL